MTLLEIMVSLAIAVGVLVVAIPAIGTIFALEQHRAAKDLALLYQQLNDEAIMRNVTFRIAFNLSDNSYQVEAGDPRTLIFENSEERDDRELVEWVALHPETTQVSPSDHSRKQRPIRLTSPMSMPSPDEALAEMNLMMLLRHYNHLLTWQRWRQVHG